MTPSTSVEPLHDGIVATGLTVARGSRRKAKEVLHQLDFTIAPGKITGLIGPSGCGKTTLMRTIVGVQEFAGELTVLGETAGSANLRGRIGYVTQAPAVYTDLTVRQNLEYFSALMGADRKGADRTGATRSATTTHAELLDKAGLADLADRRIDDLSGGQKGRASLVCALVGDPELLVLDEPTVGLDPVTRLDLWDYFRELAAEGRTLVVSSHVMDEAARCDEVLLMRRGNLLAQTTPQSLLEHAGTDSLDDAFLTLIRRQEQQEQHERYVQQEQR
ncbi:ABC transporter ATP-binding protein [Corynebacterium sp. H113]|uniref:ABC transporter ATP-binding protein n=1 Tax=Corynebacterium sp. H113 TaxID=3133419 RepID=UPI0030A11EC6